MIKRCNFVANHPVAVLATAIVCTLALIFGEHMVTVGVDLKLQD
jgi:hypothetical protein